jgi:hypothetical protein
VPQLNSAAGSSVKPSIVPFSDIEDDNFAVEDEVSSTPAIPTSSWTSEGVLQAPRNRFRAIAKIDFILLLLDF